MKNKTTLKFLSLADFSTILRVAVARAVGEEMATQIMPMALVPFSERDIYITLWTGTELDHLESITGENRTPVSVSNGKHQCEATARSSKILGSGIKEYCDRIPVEVREPVSACLILIADALVASRVVSLRARTKEDEEPLIKFSGAKGKRYFVKIMADQISDEEMAKLEKL